MWLLDFPTLVLILAGGIELGAQGLLGFSPMTSLLGPWAPTVNMAIGAAALWQLSRQRFT